MRKLLLMILSFAASHLAYCQEIAAPDRAKVKPMTFIAESSTDKLGGEPCPILSSRLLSEGNSEQLSALFKEPVLMLPGLKSLSTQIGALSAIEQVKGARFKQHKRLSVGKVSGEYIGNWVNANSTLLGPVQLHIAQSSPMKCELLALHVDYAQ